MSHYHDHQKHIDYGYIKHDPPYHKDVVSVGYWILLLIILAIPFVNVISLIFLAFSNTNENIKNYAKASLILIAIPFTMAILFYSCSAG